MMTEVREMQRVSEKVLEFDKSFIRDLMNEPSTNRINLKTAQEMIKEIIAEELTSRQRELIYLRYYEQLSNLEIAEKTGLDPSTISRTLTRVRERIRKIMQFYMKYLMRINMQDD